MSEKPLAVVVVKYYVTPEPEVVAIKLCGDEDQALRELDRQILAVIPQDGTSAPVRKSKDGYGAEVHVFNDDGQLGRKYTIQVKTTAKSTA